MNIAGLGVELFLTAASCPKKDFTLPPAPPPAPPQKSAKKQAPKSQQKSWQKGGKKAARKAAKKFIPEPVLLLS